MKKVEKPNVKNNQKELNDKTSKKGQKFRKLSEYGKQLSEKQKVKNIYGIREKQFKRFFEIAKKEKSATGENLLSLLERRIDNVVFRLKFCSSRKQARQLIVHGHFLINKKRIYSPSIFVKEHDIVSIEEKSLSMNGIKNIVEKQLSTGTKIPEWLELNEKSKIGRILRLPIRSDIQATIHEGYIVELYSK